MSNKAQTDGRRTPTGDDFGRLNTLHRQIRDNRKNIKYFSDWARRNIQSAMLESILAGNALAEIKRIVGPSRFERVVKDHQKGISESEIRSYIKLHGNPEMKPQKAAAALGIFGDVQETGPAPAPSKIEADGTT